MSKVLITGSRGFVGTNLTRYMRNLGNEVQTFNRSDSIADLRGSKFDLIIHCAAELKYEAGMFQSNVFLTYSLLELFKEGLAGKFLYIGSSSEYGRKDHAIKEDEKLSPQNMYEATKGCGSLLCEAYRNITKKPVLIARPFSLYGPHQHSNKFIPTLYSCYKNKKKALVDIYAVHDWLYIEDFVRGVELLAHLDKSDTINFGTGIQVTNGRVVEAFGEVIGRALDYDIIEGLCPYDSKTWVCDTSKAQDILGFISQYDICKGLENYLKFMEERTDK